MPSPPAPFGLIEPVLNVLDSGVLLIDENERIVLASDPMAELFGLPRSELERMTTTEFSAYTAGVVDNPPQLVRDGRLFPRVDPQTSPIVCEEFEIARPVRSVVRWVARRVNASYASIVALGTDITTEVDMARRLEQLAVEDQLTGLTNRRGAEQLLKREVARSRRHGSPLSVVLFDIDRFKSINDTHGHETGDLVLSKVARTIAAQLRDSDVAARWGGEEFLAILPATALEAARICAERVRAQVAKLSFPFEGVVTISGGVSEISAIEQATDAIARADALLYQAKRSGRNRVL